MMGKCLFMRKGENHTKPLALPTGYTKLAYIQSSGTQYVDTLFNPTQNTKLVLDMAFLGSAGTNVAGVRNNSSDTTNRFGIISFGSTSKLGAFFRDSSIQAVTLDNNRHLCDLSKDGIVFDGTSYGGANTGSFTCTYSLTLFAWNNGADGVTCNLCKVYSCQIYDNGTLVRDFVPCINASGEVGLYDLVGKQFYGNAGTGVFIGPEAAPSAGIRLGDIAEGSVVYLNESASPTAFYVAKHDYEPALNGAGRTLLVRKDCCEEGKVWDADSYNVYSSSDIDNWLNNTYKGLLDTNVLKVISTTKFYSAKGAQNTDVTSISRSVFLLSMAEYGVNYSYYSAEGSALSIANNLKIAYINGSAVQHWTRTPYNKNRTSAGAFNNSGSPGTSDCSYKSAARPCFTLPANALFDEETMLFNGKIT